MTIFSWGQLMVLLIISATLGSVIMATSYRCVSGKSGRKRRKYSSLSFFLKFIPGFILLLNVYSWILLRWMVSLLFYQFLYYFLYEFFVVTLHY